MDGFATPVKKDQRSYEDLRKENLEDNKRMLANLMADINGNLTPVTPPKQPKRKKSKVDNKKEIIRRNPVRNTRFNPDRFDIPRMRSRSGSVSSTISSCSSISSSTPSSSSEKLVVRFGFFKRPADDTSPVKSDDKESDFEDEEDEYSLPQINRKPRLQHTVKAVEDVTQEDLDMVSSFVSDKKYDSIYGTTCHQCRQKTNDMKTICRSDECCGIRGQFCGPCLRNRYGECAKSALKDPEWMCPPCRGICNCSFCRKKKGKAPTGIFIHLAREKGYHDVCSYLQRNEKL